MSALNKMTRGIFYIVLLCFMIFQSYVMGVFLSGAVLSVVMAVWSIIKPLPSVLTDRLWLVYLLTGVPFGIGIFISMLVDLIKSQKSLKQDNKQDNGNH